MLEKSFTKKKDHDQYNYHRSITPITCKVTDTLNVRITTDILNLKDVIVTGHLVTNTKELDQLNAKGKKKKVSETVLVVHEMHFLTEDEKNIHESIQFI